MVRLLICCKGKDLFFKLQTFSHFFSKKFSSCLPTRFLLPSSSLPPRFLLPSSCLPPAFLLHSIYARTHIYISVFFSRQKSRVIYSERFFNTTFFEICLAVWFRVYNFARRYRERRGHNGNDRREMYQRARKQRKRVARYTRYLTYGLIANKC